MKLRLTRDERKLIEETPTYILLQELLEREGVSSLEHFYNDYSIDDNDKKVITGYTLLVDVNMI